MLVDWDSFPPLVQSSQSYSYASPLRSPPFSGGWASFPAVSGFVSISRRRVADHQSGAYLVAELHGGYRTTMGGLGAFLLRVKYLQAP